MPATSTSSSISYSLNRAEPTVSIQHLLKAFIQISENISSADRENLYASLDLLFSNQDELTLLILENCAIDTIFHRQKIRMMDFLECAGSECSQGNFNSINATISIVNFPGNNEFKKTIIHEFTHAVSCFAFRFDPVPFVAGFGDLFPIAFKHFVDHPILPYPASGLLAKYKFPDINPSALKFRQCVREDLKNGSVQSENKAGEISIEKLDNFFSILERYFPEGVLENHALEEILPVYMECRIELLQMVNALGVPREQALDMLATKLPRIHHYVETDFKKVLKHRLEIFRYKLYTHGIESNYLKNHIQDDNARVKTSFKKDGTLHMHTAQINAPIPPVTQSIVRSF